MIRVLRFSCIEHPKIFHVRNSLHVPHNLKILFLTWMAHGMIISPIPALFMTIIWILTPPPMLITSLNSGLKRDFLKINSSWVHLPMATAIKCLMSTVTILGINMKKLVRRGPLWNRRAVWHFMKFAQRNGTQFMTVEWNQDWFQLLLNRTQDLIWTT